MNTTSKRSRLFTAAALGLLLYNYQVLPVAAANNIPQAAPLTTSNQVGVVKAVGETLAIDKKVKENALANAEKKAVKKAVARFVAPSEEPESIYQRIINEYYKYIISPTVVVNQQKLNNKLVLFCEVKVDFSKLSQAIRTEISSQQKKHNDDEVIFLIRVTGLPQGEESLKSIPVRVLNDYGMAFSQYGIAVAGSDAGESAYQLMQASIHSLDKGQSYEDYLQQVEQAVKEEVTVTYAVIGELSLQPATQNATGYYVEALCKVEVIKPSGIGEEIVPIGKYSSTFSANARTEQEAVAIATKRAAINSAKYLADITYAYWQNHKN